MNDLTAQIRQPARTENLETLLLFVSSCARRHGFPRTRLRQIELSTEEALVNIFNYSYPQTTGDVEVFCRIDDRRCLVIEISDEGIPFDLLSVQAPLLDPDVAGRPIGGLGIHMIRKLVDEVKYRRQDGKNIVTLIFCHRNEA